MLLDAFALIALLADEAAAGEVEAIIRRGGAAMNSVNFAEALDVLQRVQGIEGTRLEELTEPLIAKDVLLLAVDEKIARDAADIRFRHYHRKHTPLSLADCILLASTKEADSLATADEALIRIAEIEQIQVVRLPR